MARDYASELARLGQQLKQIQKGQRYAHGGSIEDAAIEVRDNAGTVRAVIGMQPDGTAGLIAHDGPAPGAPSAPVVTSTIGGLRVVWDGTLASGQPLPADFDHTAVHVSTSSGFTPSAATYVGTITKAGEGGMLPVLPLPYVPHHVRLTAVNTSGNAGDPSQETTATPIKVDGPDLEAGSVTAGAIQAGAVTAEKLEAILQLVTRLVAGDPTGARVELNEDGLRVYNSSGQLVIRFDAADGSAAFTGTITGSTMTGGLVQTATSGQRITLNEGNANKVLVYNSTNNAIGEMSNQGLIVKGTGGAVLHLDPNNTYPNLRLTNAAQTNSAVINVVETTPGAADLGLNTGKFTGNGVTDMKWRHFMGNDFAVIERFRETDPDYNIGGRVDLRATSASIGYRNTAASADNCILFLLANRAQINGGRLEVYAPASANSAMQVQADPAHTGNLLRLFRGGDRFTVDKDGNTNVTGMLTASNMAYGRVVITPSEANVPTSATVTYPRLSGADYEGYACASTAVPGMTVTGVSMNNITPTSATVWSTRTNKTATGVSWQVIGR